MRRRRHQLQVSTFPFLAVLLCAMGSLILLLLVLDRRAKLVALHKAHDEAAQVQAEKLRHAQELAHKTAEQQRLAAERRAEWEHRQQQLHTLLAQQEEDLLGKVQDVRGQVDAAGAKVEAEQARSLNLKEQLQIINARLFGSQQAVQARQQTVVSAAKQTEAAQRELAQQTAELLQLEQALANLKALRERQKQTYSLLPYFGKRGDNRRPIYVECDSSGVVFHPDRLAIPSFQMTAERLRAEVEQRIARQNAETPPDEGKETPVPYLLMLVRPDGVNNYYHTLQALAGMKVDFGYEFVERDWIFDFSGDAAGQPWQVAAKAPPTTSRAGAPPVPPRPGGLGSGVFAPGGQPSGAGKDDGPRHPPGGSPGDGPGLPGAGSSSDGGPMFGPKGASSFGKIAGPPPVPGLPQFPAGSAGPGQVALAPGNGFGSGGNANDQAPIGSTGVVPLTPNPSPLQGKGSPTAAMPPLSPQGRGVGGEGTEGTIAHGDSTGAGASIGPRLPGTGADGLYGPTPASKDDKQARTNAGSPSMLGSPQFGGASGPAWQAQPGAAATPPLAVPGAAPPGLPGSTGVSQGSPPAAGSGIAVAPPSGSEAGGPPGVPGSAELSEGSSGVGASATPPALGKNPAPGMSAPQGGAAASKVTAPPLVGRLLGNRDWIIYIDCSTSAVMVKERYQKFTVESLAAPVPGEHTLTQAVREMIARRQATLQPGELPYRPLLRFRVKPDGLRSYYLAYPLLAPLGLPMARENVD